MMKRILLLFAIFSTSLNLLAQDWMSKYDEVGVFENDRAYVRKNKKYGYVNRDGKEIIPCIYTSVGAFNEQDIVWVQKGELYGIYDIDGKEILAAKYNTIGVFSRKNRSIDGNPYAMFRSLFSESSDNSRYSTQIDGKLFVNNKGLKWVGKGCGRFEIYSPSSYKHPYPFEKIETDRYFTFSTSDDQNNMKWGVCDLKGNIIIPCNTYDFCYYPSEGYMPVAKITNGKFAVNYVDVVTKSLVFEKFMQTLAPTPVTNGKIIIMDDTGCQFMNMNGERTGDTYDAIFPSDDEDIYTVYKDEKYGAINPDGQVIIDVKYKLLSTADNGLICFVDKGDDGKSRYGFMSTSGEVVIPPKYNATKRFERKRAIVRQGDRYGCIDTTGREVLPCKFATIYLTVSPESDIYFVREEKDGNIYAYKAYTSSRLFDKAFKDIRNYDQDFRNVAFVSEPGHVYEYIGCIDKNGEMLIPFICSSFDNAFQLYRKRQMEGKYHWTEDDARAHKIAYHNELLEDFKLSEKIAEEYWDF